jgi:hypothetical protein
VRFDPLGVGLIIGTWNYPVMLTLSPLVAAIPLEFYGEDPQKSPNYGRIVSEQRNHGSKVSDSVGIGVDEPMNNF